MPTKPTDVVPVAATLYFLPIKNRMPLKFGLEVTTEVTCARVKLTVRDRNGKTADGWGETPLSVQWVWPSSLSYEERHGALKAFCMLLTEVWGSVLAAQPPGHPLEVGHHFLEDFLPGLWRKYNRHEREGKEPMPWLAALVCASAFDLAMHDAYGMLHDVPTYSTYHAAYMNADLSAYLEPVEGSSIRFEGKYPADFLVFPRPKTLPAWHLVGGKDPLTADDLTGSEPDDGYPVLLADWIETDGLTCLKVKLRGDDDSWDYDRLVAVAAIGRDRGVEWLTADFNCTVAEPAYVNLILDRLRDNQASLYGRLLYVEQPFPYDIESNRIDVHSVSARKPLFMDESAHDWRLVKLGRSLGWSGVALKTCKTQTGALLSLCWAKAHGMTLMVQDLTNPMLAQIPHVLLAAHAGTIMGVETNSMQFYPEASKPEAAIHHGLYRRRHGRVDLTSIDGPGFGYKSATTCRVLPEPAAVHGV
jgi:L-alanine-DL-glutamate epimerase-like enolase superfamily enzyme